MVDGLASRSLTRTWPPRQAAAASGRVLVNRTDQSHRSSRVDSMSGLTAQDALRILIAKIRLSPGWIPARGSPSG